MKEKKERNYKKINVHLDLVKLIDSLKKDIQHYGWDKIKVSDVDATSAFAEKLKQNKVIIIKEETKGGTK